MVRAITAIIILLAAVLSSGCGGDDENNPADPVTLDNSPPVAMVRSVGITSALRTVTVSLDGWDYDGIVTEFKYYTDYDANEVTVIPSGTFPGSNGLTIYTKDVTLASVPIGSHWVKLRSRDDDADWSTLASRAFVMPEAGDTIPPNTTITFGPSGTINHSTFTFFWTGADDQTTEEDLVYKHMLEGHDSAWSLYSHSTQASFLNIPDGEYTFMVRAFDEAGNAEPDPAERYFVIDTANITVISPAASTVWSHSGTCEVFWDTGGIGGYVSIHLYRGSVMAEIISNSWPNDDGHCGPFALWSDIESGDNYRVRVYYDSNHYDYSDDFRIVGY